MHNLSCSTENVLAETEEAQTVAAVVILRGLEEHVVVWVTIKERTVRVANK